jgi:Tfp pilus assembly PilM family ATPase
MLMVGRRRGSRLGVALDLGAHSLKCVEVDLDEGVVRKAWRRVLHPERTHLRDVLQGPRLQERLTALASLLQADLVPAGGLVTALQGEGTWLQYLELPPLSPPELHVAAQAAASSLLPFSLDQVTLSTPSVPSLTAGRSAVLLIAALKEPAAQRLALLAASGLSVSRLEIVPLALARAFGRNHPELAASVVVVVHLGFSSTHVLAVRDGLPYFVRDFTLGLRHFVHALQTTHRLTWSEALRRFEEGDAKALDVACNGVLTRWLRELSRTVEHMRRKVAPLGLGELWIAGGGDYMRACQLLVAAHTESVVCLEYWAKLDWHAPSSPGDVGVWVPAVGMALQP